MPRELSDAEKGLRAQREKQWEENERAKRGDPKEGESRETSDSRVHIVDALGRPGRARAIEFATRIVSLTEHAGQALDVLARTLQTFRDEALYRHLGYDSLKAWAEVNIPIRHTRIYQLLAWQDIKTELAEVVGESANALTEGQARELKRLPPAERVEVVKAIDLPKATAKEVKREVDKRFIYAEHPLPKSEDRQPLDVEEVVICPHCGEGFAVSKVRPEGASSVRETLH